MDIPRSIRMCLAKDGKTQRWLGQQLGWSDQMISGVCRSKKQISLKKLEAIAGVFDLRVSEFIALGEE